MTKPRKGYEKIISVFFRKAYLGLKSISCITILTGLVVSSVASGSGDTWFEFLYYNGDNHFIRMQIRM